SHLVRDEGVAGSRVTLQGTPGCAPPQERGDVDPLPETDPILGNTLADRARHSRVSGPRQYCAHNCTHDVHGAGGEAHWGACRIEYEIQPKERDPKAASHRQFCHVTVHMDFLAVADRE